MKNFLRCTIVFVAGVLGCHQEPLVPRSAIPLTCRIYQLININEGLRDTTTYQYNPFGLVEKSLYRQWSNGQLINEVEQSYGYTGDHYLLTQIEKISSLGSGGSLSSLSKGYTYTYQDGRIQQVSIIDNRTNDKLGFKEYSYAGETLKTYSETDGSKTLVKRYTFDNAGKLMGYEESGSGVATSLSNGKIVKRILKDTSIIEYEYDAEGQLIRQTTSLGSGRSQYTYSYDTKPHWSKTQLRLRGFPTLDLGGPTQVHNLLTSSYQDGGSKGILTYRHAYNTAGFSQGYGRSDGVRQINYYSNCQ